MYLSKINCIHVIYIFTEFENLRKNTCGLYWQFARTSATKSAQRRVQLIKS